MDGLTADRAMAITAVALQATRSSAKTHFYNPDVPEMTVTTSALLSTMFDTVTLERSLLHLIFDNACRVRGHADQSSKRSAVTSS